MCSIHLQLFFLKEFRRLWLSLLFILFNIMLYSTAIYWEPIVFTSVRWIFLVLLHDDCWLNPSPLYLHDVTCVKSYLSLKNDLHSKPGVTMELTLSSLAALRIAITTTSDAASGGRHGIMTHFQCSHTCSSAQLFFKSSGLLNNP